MGKIIGESGLPIREFVYFDREKVVDFVSASQGGLPEQHRQVTSKKSAHFDVGLKAWFLNLVRRGGTRELTWEEIQSETNASLFERLHNLLEESGSIINLESLNSEIWGKLKVGEFVEIAARIEFSALERLFTLFREFTQIGEKLGLAEIRDPKWASVMAYLSLLVEKQTEYNIRICPLAAPSKELIFVSSLPKDKVRGSRAELAGEYMVFGRIQRKLRENETFELQSLIPIDIRLPKDQVRDFLRGFKDIPQFLGPAPTMDDLEIPHPAMILTPIAIYR